ncbi:hypothetical protein [Streptomyces hilarionis]|uniref:hypothetical protein n=1 Tax=Streptomyces hilarionis TaxID=2839954 RepID=UPI003F683370
MRRTVATVRSGRPASARPPPVRPPRRRHEAGCRLPLPVQDNETVKATGRHDRPVPHDALRTKGRFGCQHAQNRG